jgi:HEAT repeat protein
MTRRTIGVGLVVLLAIGCAGSKPEKTPRELIADLKDRDESVRIRAAWGLGKAKDVPAAEAVPALSQALKDSSPYVRAAVARALGALGQDARPARDALKKALKDSDENVRHEAGEALKKIGAD